MEPISGTTHLPPAVSAARDALSVRKSEPEARRVPAKPVTDTYLPEEAHVPFGLYYVGRDEDGSPTIFFDAPALEPAEDVPGETAEAAGRPASADRTEQCTGNTDRVDREIRKLKERQERLEQQLRAETDAAKAEALRTKLARVEAELRQKDNDAYRRQHTVFS